MTWKHDELQHDLAEFRRACGEMVAEKVGLGSWGGTGQMDVATIKPSWTQPNPTCYEVKISRADFLADTQTGKYQKYLPYVRRLYFACPAGMLSAKETPTDCGLIVRGDNGWHVTRAPRVLKPEPANWPVLLQAMLMKHYPGPWAREMTRAERIADAEQRVEEGTLRDRSLRFRGINLSRQILDALSAADRAVIDHDAACAYVAGLIGEERGGRSIGQLVDVLLERRPTRDNPRLRLDYPIRTIEQQLVLIREQLDRAGLLERPEISRLRGVG